MVRTGLVQTSCGDTGTTNFNPWQLCTGSARRQETMALTIDYKTIWRVLLDRTGPGQCATNIRLVIAIANLWGSRVLVSRRSSCGRDQYTYSFFFV